MSKRKNPAAVALGKLGRNVPKRLTATERRRRAEWARGLAARRQQQQNNNT